MDSWILSHGFMDSIPTDDPLDVDPLKVQDGGLGIGPTDFWAIYNTYCSAETYSKMNHVQGDLEGKPYMYIYTCEQWTKIVFAFHHTGLLNNL